MFENLIKGNKTINIDTLSVEAPLPEEKIFPYSEITRKDLKEMKEERDGWARTTKRFRSYGVIRNYLDFASSINVLFPREKDSDLDREVVSNIRLEEEKDKYDYSLLVVKTKLFVSSTITAPVDETIWQALQHKYRVDPSAMTAWNIKVLFPYRLHELIPEPSWDFFAECVQPLRPKINIPNRYSWDDWAREMVGMRLLFPSRDITTAGLDLEAVEGMRRLLKSFRNKSQTLLFARLARDAGILAATEVSLTPQGLHLTTPKLDHSLRKVDRSLPVIKRM